MSAAERQREQAKLTDRTRTLDDIRRVGLHKWLKYAGDHDLPSDPGRCSTEVLQEAARVLLGTHTSTGATPMALTKGAKSASTPKAATPAPAAKAKAYLITFPDGKPQKATATVLEGDAPEATDGVTQFVANSPKDLMGAPMPALLALVNAGRSGTPVRKFTSEDAAIQAAWDAMLSRAETPQSKTPKESKPRAAKVVAFEPKAKEEIKQVRVGTKVATAVDLLSQDGGVLLSEFEAELSKTGKPINGRAWLGYDVAKVVGYGVRSEVDGDDLRLFLVLPKGMKAPLAHKTSEEKPKAEPKAKKDVPEAPKSKASPAEAADAELGETPEPAKKPVAKKAAAKKSAKK